MTQRWEPLAGAACTATLVLFFFLPFARMQAQDRSQTPAAEANADGWTVPPDAEGERNPVTPSPQTLAGGRALFQKQCERCHGPKGIGDGPDADPDHMADMDLTNVKRAARNPDGVVFYKVWNGRQKPKMPAFRDELTRDQVWTVVAYVQTLRKPATE